MASQPHRRGPRGARREGRAQPRLAPRPGAPGGEEEFNAVFYLPEDSERPPLAPVPAGDAAAIRRVLGATYEPAPAPGGVPLGTRAQIEPLWADRPIGEGAFAATLAPLSPGGLVLRPQEQRTICVRVRNDGDECRPYGLDQPPLFRVGFRWHGPVTGPPEGRAPFPCEIAPGRERIVPVHVHAPAHSGDWELEIDVLLERVRWFGAGCRIAARVGA